MCAYIGTSLSTGKLAFRDEFRKCAFSVFKVQTIGVDGGEVGCLKMLLNLAVSIVPQVIQAVKLFFDKPILCDLIRNIHCPLSPCPRLRCFNSSMSRYVILRH